MEGGRQEQTCDRKTEKYSAHLCDGAVVDLLSVSESTKKESHTQDQQEIGQDRAQDGSLNDRDLVLG